MSDGDRRAGSPVTPGVLVDRPGPVGDSGAVEAALRAEGLTPSRWGNGPGYRYAVHHHAYDKVLVCVAGRIVFHLNGVDVHLGPGDRLELSAGIEHGASVGDTGVECVEAPRLLSTEAPG